jgi:hypothetical protein
MGVEAKPSCSSGGNGLRSLSTRRWSPTSFHSSWSDSGSLGSLSPKVEMAAALGSGVFDSSSSRITGLSKYGQETIRYSDGESRNPRVPWLSPEPSSNFDWMETASTCENLVLEILEGIFRIPISFCQGLLAQNLMPELFD